MEKEEMNILGAIQTNIAASIQAGYKPRILLIHPKAHAQLMQQLDARLIFPNNTLDTILGLKCHITHAIRDFLIIDNRGWVDQKF
jgi:hypothetical protein